MEDALFMILMIFAFVWVGIAALWWRRQAAIWRAIKAPKHRRAR